MNKTRSEHVRVLKSLHVKNLLSFGDKSERVDLGRLNVVIGANGSGKSNFVEALSLLRAAPKEIFEPIMKPSGGGIAEWLHKSDRQRPATIEAVIDYGPVYVPLRYHIEFGALKQKPVVFDETLEDVEKRDPSKDDVFFYYRYQEGDPVISIQKLEMRRNRTGKVAEAFVRSLEADQIDPERSVLGQKIDTDLYPEITYVGQVFQEIRLFRDWPNGPSHPARGPKLADLPSEFLLESASNLAVVLNSLTLKSKTRDRLMGALEKLYEGVEELRLDVVGGTVQLYIKERNWPDPISSLRLSDGTIRFLCLLAILCHPKPPKFICIEEPEIGLHPDVIREVAELLVDASERAQFVVTTHSSALLSALTDTPECVLVCSKNQDGTQMRRLDKEELKVWSSEYSLGDIWAAGGIGGNRW